MLEQEDERGIYINVVSPRGNKTEPIDYFMCLILLKKIVQFCEKDGEECVIAVYTKLNK